MPETFQPLLAISKQPNTHYDLRKEPIRKKFQPSSKSFRMNTSKNVSKQRTLTIFRMNTCEKRGGG
jgi:hypothetical protein